MKQKVNKLEGNSKNNSREIYSYKDINELKNGYQPRAYVIKKDGGTIVADTTSILSRIKFYRNLLNVNESTILERS